METILFGAMGWCGTRYPGWWRPRPPRGGIELPQDPVPLRQIDLISKVLAIIGGIGGGLLIQSVFPAEILATSGMAAFAGGRIISDFAYGVSGMGKQNK